MAMGNSKMTSKSEWEKAKDELRKFRDEQARQSVQVLKLWRTVLSKKRNKLGDDLWPICEQVIVAACDCGNKEVAEECIRILQTKFPDSLRVQTLRGMVQELYSASEAEHVYHEIEKEDKTNTVCIKRRVAMLKGENKISEAIEKLVKHLENWQGDLESWQELSMLYSEQGDYVKACFCMEELILVHPENSQYHTQLALLLYTLGGLENLKAARKHLAQALKLQPSCTRSQLAFSLTCHKLLILDKASKKENTDYFSWVADQLAENYEDASEENQECITAVTERLRSHLITS